MINLRRVNKALKNLGYNLTMDEVVIPTNIVKKVERLSKELAAIKKEIRQAVKISKSQVWFWSKAWQRKEQAADRDLKQWKTKTFSSVKELIRDLRS